MKKQKYDEIYDTCRFCIYAKPHRGLHLDSYECRLRKRGIIETKNNMFLIITRTRGDSLDLDTCFRCTYYEKGEIDKYEKNNGIIEKHLCNLRGRLIWKISDEYYSIIKTNKVNCKDRDVRTSD